MWGLQEKAWYTSQELQLSLELLCKSKEHGQAVCEHAE